MLAQMTYGRWYPPMLSEHGDQVDLLIDVLSVFMLLLFVSWGLFYLFCLVRFRARDGERATYHPIKGKVSKYAEIGVALFEAFLLVGISMPVWAAYKNDPPAEGQREEVRVIAEQFQWNFHYPGKDGRFGPTRADLISASNSIGLDESHPDAGDDIVTINEFHMPVSTPMYLRLTSKDVIHSFSIPTMRVKQDTIPGMEIPIWFTASENATREKLLKEMTTTIPIDRYNWYRYRHYVAAKDHAAGDGSVALARGNDLGLEIGKAKESVERLKKAGVEELTLQPRNPLEVVCAQLCGNSHFKMKAQLITHTPDGYHQWIEEQSKPVEFDFEGF